MVSYYFLNFLYHYQYINNFLFLNFFLTSIRILFLMVYFNYYSSVFSEENLIDHDYLVINVTIEAEEEIGSLDDMLLASVILLYVFLWFF